MSAPQDRRRGCLIVAHGDAYRAAARLAARYFKAYNPGVPVRLCTDRRIDDGPFDEIVVLEDVWHRSKIDAMIDSPFDETLYMDADALAVLDIRDCFQVLEAHDIALCHDQFRNHPLVAVDGARALPNAYPQLNSGIIFFRRAPNVRAFLEEWRSRVLSTGSSRDQPALRDLAFETELRIAVLPPEYNMNNQTSLAGHLGFTAPRVIHSSRFYADPAIPGCAYPVLRFLGPRNYARFLDLVANDAYVRRSGSVPDYVSFGRAWSAGGRLLALKRLHVLMECRARGMTIPSSLFPTNLNVI